MLVNSNPATIMTDPELADRTYVEPLTPEFVAKIIERERPQALLPTLGGQTGLNIAVSLAEDGTLERFGVELIGAKLEAIKKAEDRALFKQAMERIGHDRGRVRVHEDDAVSLLTQHATGLRARVVELAGLPDDDRPAADQQDRFQVVASGHVVSRPS